MRTTTRVVWVDVAKALAIVLVAVHHTVLFSESAGWMPAAVVLLNEQAQAVRMPLFFLATGLFASSALRKPWAVVLRKRIAFFVYLYLLWAVIRYVFFQVVPDVRGTGLDGDLHALLVAPVLPATGLWFIYALAVFSAVAKLSLRVPAALQLLAGVLLAAVVGSRMVVIDNLAWRNMAMYYVFFLLGMHLRSRVEATAASLTVLRTAVLGVATAVALVAVHLSGARSVPGIWLLVSSLAVTFGIGLAVQLSRTGAAVALAKLGERTLPVYLMHVPWVAGLVWALDTTFDPRRAVGAGLAVLVLASAITVSLLLHRPLQRLAPWLFQLPAVRRRTRVPLAA